MICEEFEVVVVGAGPAGLASAVTLGSYGVETLVVERRASSSTLPRATVASTATMELLRRWAWRNRRGRVRSTSSGRHGRARRSPTRITARRWRWAYRRASRRCSSARRSPACLAQDELEPLLEEHLGSLESVELERGVELVALERASDGGHVLTLAGPGRRRRVRARYVIGADGVRSSVREALGIAVRGRRERRGTPRGRVPGPGLGARPRAPLRHLLPRRWPQLPSRRQAGPLGVRAWTGTAQPTTPTR